ncbi:hypothetical protein HDA32_003895 [Spinactinospora alkalitolerans]|uniref:Uncharacterized protein n=1 Tax=Spinactinospora alkalitolerans TaxID=687207 RepID=A0A852TZM8_9ACTN|nr:hypothetical protein [Spinactinospora alkalitolerans]NYE48775.1 hypothetical protein [Spinactinospora alkalitolerans]
MTRDRLTFRALRATLFAVVCAGMALAGHVIAGGAAPGGTLFGAAVAGTAAAALPFAARPRSRACLIAALLAAQGLLHALFGAAASGAAPSADGFARTLGHACASGLLTGDLPGMAVAHAWAALVTGWWLAAGEDALWAVLHWLRAALLPPPPGIGAHPAARPPRRYGRGLVPTPRLRVLRHAVSGRAPPPAF